MWMHSKTKHKYTNVIWQPDGTATVTSALSGKQYTVPGDKIVSLSDHEELRGTDDDKAFYSERIRDLAHSLARELSYNLGMAVVAIAAGPDDPANLLTARAAIRDEQERLREAVADHLYITEQKEQDVRPDEPERPWIEQHPPARTEREPGLHLDGPAFGTPDHIDGRREDGERPHEPGGFWSTGLRGGERGYGGHVEQVVGLLEHGSDDHPADGGSVVREWPPGHILRPRDSGDAEHGE